MHDTPVKLSSTDNYSTHINTLMEKVPGLRILTSDLYVIRDLLSIEQSTDENLIILLLSLFAARDDGSTCVELDNLPFFTENSEFGKKKETVTKAILDGCKKWPRLFTTNPDDFKPIIITRLKEKTLLYFHKFYIAEKKVESQFNYFLSITSQPLPKKIKDLITDYLYSQQFNEKQQAAILLSSTEKILIVSGGPGTGKTRLISGIIETALIRGILPQRIMTAAPTGKAAKRLDETIPRLPEVKKTETLHRLLGYSPQRGTFTYNRERSLPVDLVIVDEVSMVDIFLLSALFDALPEKCQIVLVGDAYQLPAVNAGGILPVLITDDFEESFSGKTDPFISRKGDQSSLLKDKIVFLTQNYRSEGLIQQVAAEIKTGNMKAIDLCKKERIADFNNFFTSPPESNVRIYLPEDNYYDDRNRLLSAFYNAYFQFPAHLHENDEKKLYSQCAGFLKNAVILTAIHDGFAGDNSINTFCMKDLKGSFRATFHGLPIMITSNNYPLQLFNGETGIIIKKNNGQFAIFPEEEGGISHTEEILPPFNPAYAISIHKSQGSEYDNVLVILPEEIHPLVTRELLYTALTRAKKRIAIFSGKETLKAAVSRKLQRTSGIILH